MTGLKPETAKRDKMIVDLYNKGIPVVDIAERLSTCRGNIYSAMKRHNDPVAYAEQQAKHELNTKRKPQ